jgi:hypothetical protein
VKKDKKPEGEEGTEIKSKIPEKRKIMSLSSSKMELNGVAPIKPGKIMIRKSDIKIKKEQE